MISVQEIDLIHSRIKSVANLGLVRFAGHLNRLCLRQNHIRLIDSEIIGALVNLEDLDLYDNKIKEVGDALSTLTKLTSVGGCLRWPIHGTDFCGQDAGFIFQPSACYTGLPTASSKPQDRLLCARSDIDY